MLKTNFLQAPVWQKTNELIGHNVVVEKLDGKHNTFMIVKKAKRGRYLEIPGGPVLTWESSQELSSAIQKMLDVAKANRCAFVRIRPQILDTPENRALMKSLGGKLSPMHLAAEHTVILDLKKSEEELLAAMRRQTRYEVRRAEKLGITVESGNSDTLFKAFHKAQVATAERQHFIPPDLKTLMAEHEAFGENARIYIARTADKKAPIAYGLILIDGEEAEYYEAASTELNRKLPGAYALQWQVIRDLKALGVKRYNLWGIAPLGQPHHRYAGVTTFKTGFGGEVVSFIPAHDFIVSKIKYAPDYLIETIRKKRRHL